MPVHKLDLQTPKQRSNKLFFTKLSDFWDQSSFAYTCFSTSVDEWKKMAVIEKTVTKIINKAHLVMCSLSFQDGFQSLLFLLRMVCEPTSTVSFICTDTCLLHGDGRMHSDMK